MLVKYSSSKSYRSAAMSSRRDISFWSHSCCFVRKSLEFCVIASLTDGKSFNIKYCFMSDTSFISDSPALTKKKKKK